MTEIMNSLAKESDPKSISRDSRDYFNDHFDTTTAEQYTTEITTTGEETQTAKPFKRSRKSKRRMKKKVRTHFAVFANYIFNCKIKARY